jgi:alkylated DNA repair dioxygenase AlkB
VSPFFFARSGRVTQVSPLQLGMKDLDAPGLFEAREALPEGFKYQAELLSPDEERKLVARVQTLPFKEFEFHGYLGKRRVVSFGWRYNFNERELQKAEDIPEFLLPLRDRAAAAFAGLEPGGLKHALVTEYSPGAAIGWHKDKAAFEKVVGISLVAPARFRFRRKRGSGWERAAVLLEPRSGYLLDGPARTEWEHSIPAMEELRYSITFRNFRGT